LLVASLSQNAPGGVNRAAGQLHAARDNPARPTKPQGCSERRPTGACQARDPGHDR